MTIIFWGSSEFSIPSLELCDRAFGVSAVVTNTDACCGRGMKEIRMTPVKKYALDRGWPVLQPCDLNDESFRRDFSALGPELSVVVSYGMIIPENILYLPKFRSINLHASLLPRYRGASPIQASLANGDAETGVTVQAMVKELDRGDILRQEKTAISPDETHPELSGRLARLGAELLVKTVQDLECGSVHPLPQDESRASVTRQIKKEDGRISFIDNPARDIYNKWRAYVSWPGIFAPYRNSGDLSPNASDVLVFLTEVEWTDASGVPGTIIQADRNQLAIACRSGSVVIRKLKPAGKKEMDAAAFVNGYRPVAGHYF